MDIKYIDLLNEISDRLISNNFVIATAESCTGGLLANLLTNISGSSSYFERGIVTYSNRSKIELLGVSEDIITKFGAVSEETARDMAVGIRQNSKVDIGISTTGIAGPKGGTDEKPVGLVYIGISTRYKTEVKRFNFSDTRLKNKEQACIEALHILLNTLKNW